MKASRFFFIVICSVMATLSANSISAAEVTTEVPTKTEGTSHSKGTYLVNKEHYGRIEQRSGDRLTQSFYAGESVRIALRGDRDTEWELFIYDSIGNLVASDTRSDATCICSFIPSRTQQYTIHIVGIGASYPLCYKLTFIQ